MHSFWHGMEKSEMHGLLVNYYLEDELSAMLEKHLDIIELQRYREDADGDSVFVLAMLPEETSNVAGENDVQKHKDPV